MTGRRQRTLRTPVAWTGFGLFGSQDVTVRILPAPEFYGRVFQRIDLPGAPLIPAHVKFVQSSFRRTLLVRGTARVEMTEHLLAALFALKIDNCLIQIDAAELPVLDGSSYPFATGLLESGIVEQSSPAVVFQIPEEGLVCDEEGRGSICFSAVRSGQLTISYELDHPHPGIGRQRFQREISPESFLSEIAFSRTFLPACEVEPMRRQGFGARATEENILILEENGPLGGSLRAPEECARHKILDCLGDFALLGCDIVGRIQAVRSGHMLNHRAVQQWSQSLAQTRASRLAG